MTQPGYTEPAAGAVAALLARSNRLGSDPKNTNYARLSWRKPPQPSRCALSSMQTTLFSCRLETCRRESPIG